ncbi:MAG: MOSC domain-containing protein [Mycobacteriales bacterium]
MDRQGDAGEVVAVSRSGVHEFSKPNENSIELVVGVGVHNDAHAGVTVQHRSRVRADPTSPNLRQVHLIHAELHDELRDRGFEVAPGQMGENVTTRGLDLLGLPRGTRLHLGAYAIVEVTGLRNPCYQLDDFHPGLMKAVLDRDEDGRLIRKAGIMGVVVAGGPVRPHDRVRVELPAQPHIELDRV